jgi:hypothetical protein
MATITKTIELAIPPAEAWDALADFNAVHERVAPGFVVDCRSDGADRVVRFVSGAVARERLVTLDHATRRLVYTVVDSPLGCSHHQASVAVEEVGGEGTSRLVWTTDLLPDENATIVDSMMDAGAVAIRRQLSGVTA